MNHRMTLPGALLILALTLVARPPCTLAQESGDADSATPESARGEEPQDGEDEDESDVFIRDGVFTPSEQIEADTEISFPADI